MPIWPSPPSRCGGWIGWRGIAPATRRRPEGPRTGQWTAVGTPPARLGRRASHDGRHGSSGPPIRTRRGVPVHRKTPACRGQDRSGRALSRTHFCSLIRNGYATTPRWNSAGTGQGCTAARGCPGSAAGRTRRAPDRARSTRFPAAMTRCLDTSRPQRCGVAAGWLVDRQDLFRCCRRRAEQRRLQRRSSGPARLGPIGPTPLRPMAWVGRRAYSKWIGFGLCHRHRSGPAWTSCRSLRGQSGTWVWCALGSLSRRSISGR